MFLSPLLERSLNSRRLAAVVLLLAVFFLPLHFHSLTLAAQVTKECSCYQGGRTQVGLAPASADWSPAFQPTFIVVYEPQILSWLSIAAHTIRAPPII